MSQAYRQTPREFSLDPQVSPQGNLCLSSSSLLVILAISRRTKCNSKPTGRLLPWLQKGAGAAAAVSTGLTSQKETLS